MEFIYLIDDKSSEKVCRRAPSFFPQLTGKQSSECESTPDFDLSDFVSIIPFFTATGIHMRLLYIILCRQIATQKRMVYSQI